MVKYIITQNVDSTYFNTLLKEQIWEKIFFILENSEEMDISYEE